MIARVEIAAVLDGERRSALLAKDAQTGFHARTRFQGDVEELHEGAAHIGADPFVENRAEEICRIAAAQQTTARPWLRGSPARSGAARLGDLVRNPLDNGNELHVAASIFPKKPVDLQRLVGVGAMDGGQRIEVDLVALQNFDAAHHAVKGRLAAFVHAIGIVQLARAVDGQADKKMILQKESRPRVVEQDAIGLKSVGDLLAVGIALLELDDAPKEVDAQQSRLPSLPGKVITGASCASMYCRM